MSRPTYEQWRRVWPSLSGDPTPGDPQSFKTVADHYQQVAEAITQATTDLNTLVSESSTNAMAAVSQTAADLSTPAGVNTAVNEPSIAVKELHEQMKKVLTQLQKTQGRYQDAAQAMQTFHQKLEENQQLADKT
ncbi:MAG: hypothetical protein LBH11_05965, partial [Propionibacteriaceae bacterium]|nr:hypothetical protein [Propionibacteriaceae bacterium]